MFAQKQQNVSRKAREEEIRAFHTIVWPQGATLNRKLGVIEAPLGFARGRHPATVLLKMLWP